MIFFKIYYHRISYYKTYNYVFLIISSISQYQNSYMIFLSAIYPLIIYFIKCDRSHRWNSLFSFDLYLQNTIYPIWPLAIDVGDGTTVRRGPDPDPDTITVTQPQPWRNFARPPLVFILNEQWRPTDENMLYETYWLLWSLATMNLSVLRPHK